MQMAASDRRRAAHGMFEMRRDKLAELQARVAKLRSDARAPGVRLSKVVIRPAKRVTLNMLPKARSGAETLAAMDRVNSDRSRSTNPPRPARALEKPAAELSGIQL